MPIDASPSGTLDIENATLRSREIVALTNMVAGNDVVRADGPALEVYGDPGPRLELVSNTAATDGTATFTRLESNVGVFSIQSGTDGATNGPITFGGFQNERLRITTDGNVGVGTVSPSDALHVYGSPMIQHDTTYDFANNQGWYKIGVWDPTNNTGARLKIKFLGMEGYSSQSIARGGETILYASCNNNIPDTKANIDGRLHAYGNPAITQVKFIHLDGSRHKFEIRAYIKTYVQMSMTVECTQTESFTKDVTASTDPGVESATVSHAIFTHVVNNVGNVGIGTTTPTGQLEVHGPGQTSTTTFSQSGNMGATLALRSDDGVAGSGGGIMFGATQGFFAAIKGTLSDGADNTSGELRFYTRNPPSSSTMQHNMSIDRSGNVSIPDGTLNVTENATRSRVMRLGVASGGTGMGFYMGTGGADVWAATNISLRSANSGGGTVLFVFNINRSGGDATSSHFYMIRKRYDGGSNWTSTASTVKQLGYLTGVSGNGTVSFRENNDYLEYKFNAGGNGHFYAIDCD